MPMWLFVHPTRLVATLSDIGWLRLYANKAIKLIVYANKAIKRIAYAIEATEFIGK